jgi:gliding motility-associated-like protein
MKFDLKSTMLFRRKILLHAFLFIPWIAFSQCLTNGVDTNKCYAKIPFPPVNFSISKEFESVDQTAVYTSPLVIDTDGDCIPEIIMSSNNGITNNPNPRTTRDIKIVNSANGQTITTISTAFYSWHAGNSYVVADVNSDGNVEIILAAADIPANPLNLRGRLICYNMNGGVNWISNQPFGANSLYAYGGTVGLADFNRDGIPECYIYNEIFNAQTGVKLADGGTNGIGLGRDVSPPEGSLAVGIAGQFNTSTFNLELACGYTTYEIVINNPNGTIGNTMTPLNIQVDGLLRDGYTSMADINQDGILDIVVASKGDQNTARLYAYFINNNVPQLIAKTTMPTGGGNQILHVGTPFIGDMDGTSSPTIGIARPFKLLAYKYNGTQNLVQLWDMPTNDASGETGLTMFDFNQDGTQEIVYRDMGLLRILDASAGTPNVLASFTCTSGTGIERPIVIDLHANGESQICVTCGPYNGGKVEVFSSSPGQQPWAPSRSIWNQYSYHVFNINNNLTIPTNPINNATFGNGLYNNFFVQMSLVDSTGIFMQNASDANVNIGCINYDPVNNEVNVNYAITNSSSASSNLVAGSIVSIYNGSNLLDQFGLPNLIQPGGIEGFSNNYNLNSINPSLGITISILPNGLECDTNNNQEIRGIDFVLKVIDTTLCSNQTLLIDGIQIQSSGVYYYEIPSIGGCDSIIEIYQVTVNPIIQNTINVTSCDSLFLNGQTYMQTGVYNQLLVNQYGCDSILTINSTIHPSHFISEPMIACENFNWNGQDVSNSGVFSYTFQNQYGCDSIREIDVFMVPSSLLPVASFNVIPNPVIIPDGNIQITNLSENQIFNTWYFSDDHHASMEFEPPHRYINSGNYFIQLVVEDENGCTDTAVQQMIVYDELILFVPNTFTPDGDEHNHNFLPIFSVPSLVDEYNLSIFNRWGELIFESNDKYIGWDGYYKFRICKSDVYTWKIIYSSTIFSDKKSLEGHVTLLK